MLRSHGNSEWILTEHNNGLADSEGVCHDYYSYIVLHDDSITEGKSFWRLVVEIEPNLEVRLHGNELPSL